MSGWLREYLRGWRDWTHRWSHKHLALVLVSAAVVTVGIALMDLSTALGISVFILGTATLGATPLPEVPLLGPVERGTPLLRTLRDIWRSHQDGKRRAQALREERFGDRDRRYERDR